VNIKDVIDLVIREIHSAWRFRWSGIAVAWTLFVLGCVAVVLLPNQFEARARVFVDTSSVLTPILNNRIVPIELGTELQYVRQALLGREHLENVVKENALDVDLRNDVEREQLLNSLRTDIRIESRDNANTMYNITYRNSDRDKAIGVVTTLLNSFVENTLGAGREGSQTAEQFVDARIEEYENRLQDAEDARAEFKKRNADRLPGSEGGYFERMRLESQALDESRKALRLAQAKRDRLTAQLAGEVPVIPSNNVQTVEPQPNSLDARIRDYRAQLDTLLLQYTDKHPDVISVREALASLEKQRREQLAALGVEEDDLEVSSLESNPIYQATRMALNQIEVEIEALEVDVEDRTRRVKELQALINDVPEVEAELAKLNRDYEVVYEQYQGLVRSRETQELSRKAADTEEVKFRIIDPPLAEFKPVAPKRALMLSAIFCIALGAGGGMCWLRAQLHPVFSSIAELRKITGLPILGAVARIADPGSRSRRLHAVLAFASALSLMTVIFLVSIYLEVFGSGLRTVVGLG